MNSKEVVSEQDLLAATSSMDSGRLPGARPPLKRRLEGSGEESDTTSTQNAGLSNRSKRICLETATHSVERDLSDHGSTPCSESHKEDSRKFLYPVEGVNHTFFVNPCCLSLNQTIADNLFKCCGDLNALHLLSNLDTRAPLCTAVKNKDYPLAELLISFQADVNAVDENGKPPIFYAFENVDGKMITLLVNNGAIVENFSELYHSVGSNGMELFESLLQPGYDVNAKGQVGYTNLHFAVSRACKHILEGKCATEIYNKYVYFFDRFLRLNADVNLANNEGLTPLHTSARYGNVEISTFLLNKGANSNARSKDGDTPLHLAVFEGHADIVKLLLERGAETDCCNSFGRYPLHLACERGHTRIVEILLDFGDCVDARGTLLRTPLHFAVMEDHEEVVKLLLDRGAQVILEDRLSYTPLHLAAARGNTRIIAALLASGACINAKTRHKVTPLYFAVYRDREEAVKLLLDRGAQVNFEDRQSHTPLHLATARGRTGTIDALLVSGAYINAKTRDGETPLHFAVHRDYEEAVKLLLDRGAEVNLENRLSYTPLLLAAARGRPNTRIIADLLASGACVNAKTRRKETPLYFAVFRDREETLKLLLERGADLHSKSPDGETPLRFAASRGYSGIMEILLKFGARVNARSEDSQTALHAASKASQASAVAILLNNGADISMVCRDSYTPFDYAWGGYPVESRAEYYRDVTLKVYREEHDTIDAFFRHQVKMEAAGLDPMATDQREGGLEDFYFGCQLEIARMKSFFIAGTNVTYFDIVKNGSKCVAKYMKNKSIVLASEYEDYKREFPIYTGIIAFKFREGLVRNYLVERATQVFHRIRGWPEECTANVLDFLDYDDLKVLLCLNFTECPNPSK